MGGKREEEGNPSKFVSRAKPGTCMILHPNETATKAQAEEGGLSKHSNLELSYGLQEGQFTTTLGCTNTNLEDQLLG